MFEDEVVYFSPLHRHSHGDTYTSASPAKMLRPKMHILSQGWKRPMCDSKWNTCTQEEEMFNT